MTQYHIQLIRTISHFFPCLQFWWLCYSEGRGIYSLPSFLQCLTRQNGMFSVVRSFNDNLTTAMLHCWLVDRLVEDSSKWNPYLIDTFVIYTPHRRPESSDEEPGDLFGISKHSVSPQTAYWMPHIVNGWLLLGALPRGENKCLQRRFFLWVKSSPAYV